MWAPNVAGERAWSSRDRILSGYTGQVVGRFTVPAVFPDPPCPLLYPIHIIIP